MGARARAKRDLSDSLRTHALRLFIEKGFDAVTVADIAEAADVTPRTFFRYFPSKETVVTDLMDGTNDRLVALLGVVDASGTMFDLISRAFHLWFEEYFALYDTVRVLVTSSPALSASMLHRSVEWELHLAEVFQRRFPGMAPTSARMWGSLTYMLTRFIGDASTEQNIEIHEAIDPTIAEFIRLTVGEVQPDTELKTSRH